MTKFNANEYFLHLRVGYLKKTSRSQISTDHFEKQHFSSVEKLPSLMKFKILETPYLFTFESFVQ